MTVSKKGKRVPKYLGDKVELYEFEKRSIVEKGMGLGSDGNVYISKEALEHFKKVEKGGQSGLKKGEKGANDNIIKPYTGPSTGYKSKVDGKVVVESSVLDKYFGGKIKLKDHEDLAHGGHTKALHVGLSEKKLKERIANDPSKKIATTYPNEKVAESVISEVIVKNEAEIIKWFEKSNPFSKKEFGAKLGIYTGYGINKAGEKINMNKATVVLKKMDDGSIKIHTSYPVEKLKGE